MDLSLENRDILWYQQVTMMFTGIIVTLTGFSIEYFQVVEQIPKVTDPMILVIPGVALMLTSILISFLRKMMH